MTARHMDSLIRLAEANARIELRHHVNSRDIDHAIAVMLESFIQSQKHQALAHSVYICRYCMMNHMYIYILYLYTYIYTNIYISLCISDYAYYIYVRASYSYPLIAIAMYFY